MQYITPPRLERNNSLESGQSESEKQSISTRWYGYGCSKAYVKKHPVICISVSLILILSFIYKICNASWIQSYSESGSLQDLFINFEGGFVRRGLLGEVFYQIVKFTGIDANMLIVPLCVVAFAFVSIALIYLCYKRGISWWIVLSPFLCGMLYSVVRRDFLLYTLLICSLSLLRHNVNSMKIFGVTILSIIALFIHEAYIFWSIPVIFLSIFRERPNRKSAIAFIVICITMFLILCHYKGSNETAQSIISSWRRLDDRYQLCDKDYSLIMALGWDLKHTFDFHLHTNFYAEKLGWLYLIIRPLYGVLIFWFLSNVIFALKGDTQLSTSSNAVLMSGILAMEFILMLPMFTVLSCDFGRSVQHVAIASYSMYLILGKSSVIDCFSTKYRQLILRINELLRTVLKPKISITIILLLILAEVPAGHYIQFIVYESPLGCLLTAII